MLLVQTLYQWSKPPGKVATIYYLNLINHPIRQNFYFISDDIFCKSCVCPFYIYNIFLHGREAYDDNGDACNDCYNGFWDNTLIDNSCFCKLWDNKPLLPDVDDKRCSYSFFYNIFCHDNVAHLPARLQKQKAPMPAIQFSFS